MKISDKRKEALYDAIYEPVLKMRLKQVRHNSDLDNELYALNQDIWKAVVKVLECGE